MTIYTLIPLVSLFICVWLFTYIYAQNVKHRANRAFLIYNLISCLYLLQDVLLWSTLGETIPIIIAKISSIVWLSIAFWFMNFIYVLINKKRDIIYYALALISIICIFVSLSTELVIKDYKVFYWGVQSVKGPLYVYFIVFSVILPFAHTTNLLLKKYFTTRNSNIANQYLLLVISSTISIVGGGIFSVILPLLDIRTIPQISPEFAALQLLVVYYAFRKYKLLSIDIEDIADDLFYNLKEGVLILDDAGQITKLNPAAEEICQKSINNTNCEVYLTKLIPDFDINKTYDNEEIFVNESLIVRLSMFDSTTSYNKDGKIIIVSDITEQKKVEYEKHNIQKKMFQASKLASIGSLATGVAHEINNPLMIIQGNVEILEEQFADSKSKIGESLIRVHNSIRRVSSIVEGLRSYTKSDSENFGIVDINEIITESVSIVSTIYSKQGIDLVVDLCLRHTRVFGNSGKIQQVIMNLLSNAKDAVAELEDGAKIQIKTKIENDNVVLCVIDNGLGMDEEISTKVFDSFYTTKEAGKGTGLGLSISKTIVESMDGTIKFISNPKTGTSFYVSLPLVS
jgi:signal transduction histidine kinase